MKTVTESLRIYVADLGAYNNGALHGAWIDTTLSEDEIHEQIQAMRVKPRPGARSIGLKGRG